MLQMKKGLLCGILALIIILTAVPAGALSAADEPWNIENQYDIIDVEFDLDENDGSATVSWDEQMADYYDVYLVRLGSNDKYSPAGASKRVYAGSELNATFSADYFNGHQDIENEYKFCILGVSNDDGELYYSYGESFEFCYGEFFNSTVLTVNVTSFLEEEIDPVTVIVRETEMDDPFAYFSKSACGYNVSFKFDSVHNEERIIVTILKKNHVTREYEISYFEDTTLDVVLHPVGDLDGDGKVSAFDYSIANAHAKGVRLFTDPYIIKVADIDGNGSITAFDASRINAHAKGINLLW